MEDIIVTSNINPFHDYKNKVVVNFKEVEISAQIRDLLDNPWASSYVRKTLEVTQEQCWACKIDVYNVMLTLNMARHFLSRMTVENNEDFDGHCYASYEYKQLLLDIIEVGINIETYRISKELQSKGFSAEKCESIAKKLAESRANLIKIKYLEEAVNNFFQTKWSKAD